jgi:phenylpyruvate tautomerase PptA (4-oxalocrotonate tautomerase family)
MPVVKIELLKGKDPKLLFRIRDLVLDSVVETLQLPESDRNIRILEYEPGFFQMKPPYQILIEITLFSGRTKETKRKLFESIVTKLSSENLAEKDVLLIILNEQPKENWGVRGGLPASEIELGFKTDI